MSGTSGATVAKAGNDHGFKNEVKRLGQQVGQLHDDLSGVARGTGEAAQAGVVAAKEGGQRLLEAAKDKSDQAAASLRQRIADHPGATVGIAVAAGILIGLVGPAILRSRRRAS